MLSTKYTDSGREDTCIENDSRPYVRLVNGEEAPGDSAERVLARLAWRVDIPSSSTFFNLTKPRNHLHHPKATAREKTAS